MPDMPPGTPSPLITNAAHALEENVEGSPHAWNASWKVLTPGMRERGGSLGVNQCRLKPGQAGCPFHWHAQEDEVFYVLSGRGVLRYGDQLREIGPGDCIACPAGTLIAHQLGNPFDEDLVYLAIGPHVRSETCGYPDTGKVSIRTSRRVGFLTDAPYMDGEPDVPPVLDLWAALRTQAGT